MPRFKLRRYPFVAIEDASSTPEFLVPAQWSNKQISKYYDFAQGYFSNKQFREAYYILETLTTPPKPKVGDLADEIHAGQSPIATAKPSLRVKVWILYFKLLDAVIGSGPNEGVSDFGPDKWSQITSKAVDSSIWELVLQNGYGGLHANMEAEVVWHLGQLVYLHTPGQKDNQRHLESYISTATQPRLDPSSSDRELRSYRSITHLLATSVLPSNGEWDYARTLITLSDVLTQEEREGIRQQLSEAEQQSQQTHVVQLKEPLGQLQELSQEQQQQVEGPDAKKEDNEEEPTPAIPSRLTHRRDDSEKDFGIEDAKPSTSSPQLTPRSSLKPSSKSIQPQAASSSPTKSTNHPTASRGIYKRSAALMTNMQRLITNLTQSASRNPMALLRFVLFLVGLVVALSRRDVKEKIRQALEKVQRTIGMGVKVSYI